MKMTEFLLGELDAETAVSRRVLESVPDGRYDWKPHEKSMAFGYLAELVARIPSWISMTVDQDQLEMRPSGGRPAQKPLRSSKDLVAELDDVVAKARASLSRTSDEHLMTPWKLLVSGNVVLEQPRYVVIRDMVLNHAAHHRGQLTVYLRLAGAKVPHTYGSSADGPTFTP
jgi:hypothetical protein